MTWRVHWSNRAADDLRRLAQRDERTARRIGQAVTRLAENRQGDLRKIAGADEWRLRVGDWRVRFMFDQEGHTIVVTRVLPRKEAYRD